MPLVIRVLREDDRADDFYHGNRGVPERALRLWAAFLATRQ